MTLKEAIQKVLGNIEQNSARYTNNESATCLHLVLPLLKALGWSDTDIYPNERTGDGFPDYTLYKDGQKKLMIEAKALNKPLDSSVIRQLGRYLQSEGVSYGLLTDGAKYELYKAFREGSPFNENLLWDLDLKSDGNLKNAEQNLKTISYGSIDNLARNVQRLQKKVRERLEREQMEQKAKQERLEAMGEVWGEMLEKLDDLVMALKPVLIENLHTTHPDKQFDEVEVQDFVKEKVGKLFSKIEQIEVVKPIETTEQEWGREESSNWTKFSRPGTLGIGVESFNCHHANDILIHTAEWLINQSKLVEKVPTGRRYLIAREPKDPRGKNFHSPYRLSNGWWLETCFNSPDCEAKAREMLKFCGFEPNLLRVDWIEYDK